MERERVAGWLDDYERAWRAEGTRALGGLFAEGAEYRPSPFAEPATGLEAIGELWEREREGPEEAFEIDREVVAVEGRTAVVRVEVHYGTGARYRDLWVIEFDEAGRCRRFEEWPFWPGQPISAAERGER